jgi:hypothetical protein
MLREINHWKRDEKLNEEKLRTYLTKYRVVNNTSYFLKIIGAALFGAAFVCVLTVLAFSFGV